MGYDMYWKNHKALDQSEHQQAQEQFFAAANERDALPKDSPERDAAQQKVSKLYARMNETQTWYYRLNAFGMGQACNELAAVGVICPVKSPPWPRPEQFGLTEYPDDVTWDDPNDRWTTYAGEPVELSGPMLEYMTAVRKTTDDPPPGDCHGIASYKFGTNDGWLVTPGEIRVGVAWADEHHPGWRDGLTDYVLGFVVWMTESIDHGGFRVH